MMATYFKVEAERTWKKPRTNGHAAWPTTSPTSRRGCGLSRKAITTESYSKMEANGT